MNFYGKAFSRREKVRGTKSVVFHEVAGVLCLADFHNKMLDKNDASIFLTRTDFKVADKVKPDAFPDLT